MYNTAEKHNIINVVLAGKAAEKFPRKKSGKRVNFAVNLISSFHEVSVDNSQEGPSQEGSSKEGPYISARTIAARTISTKIS